MSITSFYSGGMRYSPCGRKRKTTAYKSKKRAPVKFSAYIPTQRELDAHQERKAHHEKYPSYDLSKHTENLKHEDNSWKIEESKNFTVAPAYNKGAYQVIPRGEVKCIGK